MLRGFFGNLIFSNFCHYCSNVVRKSSQLIATQVKRMQEGQKNSRATRI